MGKRSNHEDKNFLGQGSYGKVVVKHGCAVKKFARVSHLVQEGAAIYYMSGCGSTVEPVGIDFARRSLSMELYDTSLRKWLREHRNVSTKQAHGIFRDILEGLVALHSLGLVHGDLKPGNILVRENPEGITCVLGDLGFVSVARYSKCDRTAPVYRDPVVVCSPAHDMFSLGVMILEILGGWKIQRQQSYDELFEFADKSKINRKYHHLIYTLIQPSHDHRPSAAEVYQYLFEKPAPVKIRPATAKLESERSLTGFQFARHWFQEAAKHYSINRPLRGVEALVCFFGRHATPEKWHHFYALVMLMVLSAIFGPSGFSEKHVLSAYEQNSDRRADRILPTQDDVYKALEEIVKDRDVLSILFRP